MLPRAAGGLWQRLPALLSGAGPPLGQALAQELRGLARTRWTPPLRLERLQVRAAGTSSAKTIYECSSCGEQAAQW